MRHARPIVVQCMLIASHAPLLYARGAAVRFVMGSVHYIICQSVTNSKYNAVHVQNVYVQSSQGHLLIAQGHVPSLLCSLYAPVIISPAG